MADGRINRLYTSERVRYEMYDTSVWSRNIYILFVQLVIKRLKRKQFFFKRSVSLFVAV